MRVSKDPLEPLRCWKELFLGERTFKSRKRSETQRRFVVNDFTLANQRFARQLN